MDNPGVSDQEENDQEPVIDTPMKLPKRGLIYNKYFLLATALVILLALVGLGLYLYLPFQKVLKPQATTPTFQMALNLNQITDNPERAAFKVGEETLYNQDILNELNYLPLIQRENALGNVVQKIASDSVTLQAAKTEYRINLDQTIYNSLTKDYKKRLASVSAIQQQINNQDYQMEGAIVAIWFLNDRVGPLGYKKSRSLALEKITALHQDVRAKKITAQQAGETVKNDASLASLDPSYQTNALYPFKINQTQILTTNRTFNNAIKNLSPGETTDIFVLRSRDLDKKGELVDAYYAFASLNAKNTIKEPVSYQNWLSKHLQPYQIQPIEK